MEWLKVAFKIFLKHGVLYILGITPFVGAGTCTIIYSVVLARINDTFYVIKQFKSVVLNQSFLLLA